MATKQENVNLLERSKTKPPRLYKVILLNDDFTTMEFVVEVLRTFFSMGQERAMQVMLQIHNEGSATCGLYPKDIRSEERRVGKECRSRWSPYD